jgi:UPF0755 protein
LADRHFATLSGQNAATHAVPVSIPAEIDLVNDRNNQGNGIFGRAGDQNNAPSGPIIPVSPSQALKPEKAPPPPKRSRRARNQVVVFLNFILSLVIFVAVIAVGVFWYGKTEFEGRGPLDRTTNYMVREGAGLNQIAAGLERQGIITNQRVFSIGAKGVLGDDTLKAGEYEIKAGSSMLEIVELMQSGKSILHAFTVPEGQTVAGVQSSPGSARCLKAIFPRRCRLKAHCCPRLTSFRAAPPRAEILEQMKRRRPGRSNRYGRAAPLICRSRLRKSW